MGSRGGVRQRRAASADRRALLRDRLPLAMGAFADAAGVTTAFTTAGIIVMLTAIAGVALSSRLRAA